MCTTMKRNEKAMTALNNYLTKRRNITLKQTVCATPDFGPSPKSPTPPCVRYGEAGSHPLGWLSQQGGRHSRRARCQRPQGSRPPCPRTADRWNTTDANVLAPDECIFQQVRKGTEQHHAERWRFQNHRIMVCLDRPWRCQKVERYRSVEFLGFAQSQEQQLMEGTVLSPSSADDTCRG